MTTNQEKFPSKTLDPSAWLCFWLMAGFFLFWVNFGIYFVGFFTFLLEPVFLIIFGWITVAVVRHRPAGRRFGLSMRGLIALIAYTPALIFVLTMREGLNFEPTKFRLNVIVREAATGRAIVGARVTAFGRRDGDYDEGPSHENHENALLAAAITDKEGRGTLKYQSGTAIKRSWVMVRTTFYLHPIRIEVKDHSDYCQYYYAPKFPTEHHLELPISSFPPAKPMSVEIQINLDKSRSKPIPSTDPPIIP